MTRVRLSPHDLVRSLRVLELQLLIEMRHSDDFSFLRSCKMFS